MVEQGAEGDLGLHASRGSAQAVVDAGRRLYACPRSGGLPRSPTQHLLYFGIQVKKGKLDSSGVTPKGNVNIAEIHHQALMMLGHEIFDDLRQALDAISHTRRGAH
jgi:hypothetical protein